MEHGLPSRRAWIIEVITATGIVYFAGTVLDSANLLWFLGLNLGIGLPWILGLLAGEVIVWRWAGG